MADNIDVTPGTGKTVAGDEIGGILHQRVKVEYGDDGSATDVSSTNRLPVISTQSGTFAVYFDQSNPSVNVGTPTITGITNSIGVHIFSTAGTINVSFKPGTLAVQLDPGHLLGSVTANAGTGTMTVAFDPGHELGTIKGNSNTLTVFLPDTGHTIGKVDAGTGTFNVKLDPGYTLGKVDAGSGTFTVKFDPGYELGSVKGINNSINVYVGATAGTIGVRVGQVDGTVAVYFSQSKPAVLADSQHTASIFTVSGSTSGVSASGVNLVAPSASYNFKVFAFSVQTTAQVSLNVRFVNGAGGGQTEFWRPLITASGVTGAQGANLAVPPPSYLFATGTSTSLNILLDSASLVHYSVSFIKESA